MSAQQLGFDTLGREQALERVICHTDDPWKQQALQAIGKLASTGRVFQAADLGAQGVPEPAHPSRWGGLFVTAARAGLIEFVGFAQSTRPTVQGSAVKTWRGKDSQPTADRIVELRALSIHRPYAALILAGIKPIENRTWSTRYRGLIVIHASKSTDTLPTEQLRLLTTPHQTTIGMLPQLEPHGFVGVAELVGICEEAVSHRPCECGPWALPNNRHWRLANPTPFHSTVRANGRQGLFIPPLIVEDMARRAHTHPEGIPA